MSACKVTGRETATATGTDTGTGTGTGTVSRTSDDAPAFNFDVMPKITTPAATSAAQSTAASASGGGRTVKIENKCPPAEATALSYQREAKRAAPRNRIGEIAPPTGRTPTGTAALSGSEKTGSKPTPGANPCEEISRNLALRKAQLRAAFFGEPKIAIPERTPKFRVKAEPFKPVQQLIEQFQAMIVQQEQQQQQQLSEGKSLPGATASNSDEGCNVTGGGLSPYSSDSEDLIGGGGGGGGRGPGNAGKVKVTRCASSDSALGLEVDDSGMDTMPVGPPQRRMTLTVTDLPLRPALLPLAEPTALADSPLPSPTGAGTGASACVGVPTKVLLEERVVAAPGSRRESTQSSYSELGASGFPMGVRYVRTPSVVVSDYSDDITACGISMEEMEYFRLQRARCQRRCSLEAGHMGSGHVGSGAASGGGMPPGCAKDEGQSDVSAASSCSNLYYCGSTISALDGGECIVNGIRVALARKSSTQSSSLSDGAEDEEEEEEDEEEEDLEERRERERERELNEHEQMPEHEDYERGEQQLSELLAATQLGDRQRDRSKKVGAPLAHQRNLKLE